MSKFDPKLWKSRSWARLERAVAAGTKDVSAAERSWFHDVVAVNDMCRIVAWCDKRRIDVEFSSCMDGSYLDDSRSISVSCNMRPLKQEVILIHECGHALAYDARARLKKRHIEPDGSTFVSRLTWFEEELDAWNRGWRLSRRLKLNITRETFDEVRTECLKSYVKWMLKPSVWKP
jgi:hypothetical protein